MYEHIVRRGSRKNVSKIFQLFSAAASSAGDIVQSAPGKLRGESVLGLQQGRHTRKQITDAKRLGKEVDVLALKHTMYHHVIGIA